MTSKAVESATLPDVMVRCGPLPPAATSFEDPCVTVEVMSPGNVARDRSEKWTAGRRLAVPQHDVLVDRDTTWIEVLDRAGDVWAARQTLQELDDRLQLSALDVSMPLAEIYQNVINA